MTGSEVIDVARESVFVMLQLAGPLMAIALVVGLAIATAAAGGEQEAERDPHAPSTPPRAVRVC